MAGGKQRKLPTSSFNSLCLNDDRLAGIEGAGRGCQLIAGNLGEAGAHNHGPGSGCLNWKKNHP
jgi:hypothetical protein